MSFTNETSSNESEIDELLQFEAHLRDLAHRMLRGFPSVRRWEETDDIVQAALIRFHTSMRSITVESPLHMQRLAALQIRRELLNLAERYRRDSSHAANHESCQGELPAVASGSETPSLEEWAQFHRSVEGLPDSVMETFDLIWYAGLSQQQAADHLKISLRQCQRRWTTAKLMIAQQVSPDLIIS